MNKTSTLLLTFWDLGDEAVLAPRTGEPTKDWPCSISPDRPTINATMRHRDIGVTRDTEGGR